MKKERRRRAGTAGAARRKHRPRPMPRWLKSSRDLNAIARSRCLMVLSVLSGETPVSDAIQQAKISRGTYYQMETRALGAMLAVLNPAAVAKSGSPDLEAAAARIGELQRRIARLEQEKRRTQRLLHLTRKTIWGRVTTGRRGRPPKNALLGSIPSGRPRSRASKEKPTFTLGSMPTKAGGSGAP